MASTIANLLQGRNNGNSVSSAVNQVRAMGPSQVLFDRMYGSDPRFRQFADSMRGKTPEQAFRENGLDFSQFRNQRW